MLAPAPRTFRRNGWGMSSPLLCSGDPGDTVPCVDEENPGKVKSGPFTGFQPRTGQVTSPPEDLHGDLTGRGEAFWKSSVVTCGTCLCVNFIMLHRHKLFLTSHLFSLTINLLNFLFIDVINVLLQIQCILPWAYYYNPLINPMY